MGIVGLIQGWIARTALREASQHFVNAKRLAFYVGLIAFLLAPVMIFNWAVFGACFRDSISHFYYSRFTGDVLVGALVFIAAFLFAYQGRFRIENTMAKFAGLGALGVAWSPVSQTGCEGRADVAGRSFNWVATNGENPFDVAGVLPPPEVLAGAPYRAMFQFYPNVDIVHFTSAALLLGTLIVFCIFIFPIAEPEERTESGLLPGKSARNKIYYTCGAFMAGALVVILANSFGLIPESVWTGYNVMFWMEYVILFFFGLCWMTKGRFEYVRDSWTGKLFKEWFMDEAHRDVSGAPGPAK